MCIWHFRSHSETSYRRVTKQWKCRRKKTKLASIFGELLWHMFLIDVVILEVLWILATLPQNMCCSIKKQDFFYMFWPTAYWSFTFNIVILCYILSTKRLIFTYHGSVANECCVNHNVQSYVSHVYTYMYLVLLHL